MRRVANGEPDPTMRAIVHALYPVSARVRTLTWAIGSEFAEHDLIDIARDATSYFASVPAHRLFQKLCLFRRRVTVENCIPVREAAESVDEDLVGCGLPRPFLVAQGCG